MTNRELVIRLLSEGPKSVREIASLMSVSRRDPVTEQHVRQLIVQIRAAGYPITKRSEYRLA